MQPPGLSESFLLWSKIISQARSAFGQSFSVEPPLPFSPAYIQSCLEEFRSATQDNPQILWRSNQKFLESLWALGFNTLLNTVNLGTLDPPHTDKRFSHPLWKSWPPARFVHQTYLVFEEQILTLIETSQLPPEDKKQLLFWVSQGLTGGSPNNAPWLNPEFLEKTLAQGGLNLVKGFGHLTDDFQKGPLEAFLALTKPKGFQVGETLASTPGHVIYQNDLLQLIQYTPRTPTTFEVPLLIAPPWINKFYIFDLQPDNSFVRWALDQGHTVFMISWINPQTTAERGKTFEAYLLSGLLAAVEVVRSLCDHPKVNLMGLCVGGTLINALCAYTGASGRDIIQTRTSLASIFNPDEIGELSLFLQPQHFHAFENNLASQGALDGHQMAFVFSLLRAQDMIWTPLVRRYFMGEEAPKLDFLFWNGDPLQIPAPLHMFFLKNFLKKNPFSGKESLFLGGIACDLQSIAVPHLSLGALRDHIVPWKAAYPQTFGPQDQYVLSTSGHTAGVINPPEAQKYSHWTGPLTPEGPESWKSSASETPGSWWPAWQAWIIPFCGASIPQRPVGSVLFPPLETAPGSYVGVSA